MKKQILINVCICIAALMLTGCGKQKSSEEDTEVSEHTEALPAKYKADEEVPKPDLSEAATSPSFQKAIQDAAALLGAKPQRLESAGEGGEVKGGVSFDVPPKKIEELLRQAHTDFLDRGSYLFRYHQSFGIGGQPDKIGLLPTNDKYAVMALMEINGINYDIGTSGVIAWMKELEQEQPYILTGISFDYMEGYFTTPVKSPNELAKRMYQFCPDIVDQGVGDVNKLAAELKKGQFYFWWD